jgi:hypothetical protein
MAPRSSDSRSDSGSEDDEQRAAAADDIAGGEDGDFGEWEEDDEEARVTLCLFSAARHASPTAALRHAADTFGFDLKALHRAHSLDFYSTMQSLNFARTIAAKLGVADQASGAAAVGRPDSTRHVVQRTWNPRFRRFTTPYDVAGNIWQALGSGEGCDGGDRGGRAPR